MAASADPLVVGRVIGDVVDMFMPSVNMSIYFGPKHVTNGCTIKPSVALDPPRVVIGGHPDVFFTLVMTDPDAPSPSEPSMREWIHWIVTDIPGGTTPSRGKEVVAYTGPRPPVGIHRYILVLFEQKQLLGSLMEVPSSRANFNTRLFANRHGLGLPVATVYFNAQKEPANKKR
ncbi:protein MOTHER of FT and TFL1 [Silene latifolia]|uniref:protein MOTHER of FT and TFL1 n=1 Tax=Silene latifolia TaxID=37657 RepID=UPI003D76EC8C